MFRRNQLVDYLRTVPLFSTCTRAELRILARHMEELEVPAGTVLCQEGDPGDSFYLMLQGSATVTQTVAGERRVLASLGETSWFGELALLDPAPRSASVTADTPVLVATIRKPMFLAILRDVPALADRLLAELARRVREPRDAIAPDVGVPATPAAADR